MRLKAKLLSICLVLITSLSYGQFIVSMGIGGTGYQGDISPFSSRISFAANNKLAFQSGIGYSYNEYIDLKMNYLVGRVEASDKNSVTESRIARNLSFTSKIKEISITGDLYFLDMFRKYKIDSKFRPFLTFGIGVFYFNPMTNYKGAKIALQPLGTEGQGSDSYPNRKKYSLYQISIPMGIGLSYEIDEQLSIQGQISPRWTFTDYLDDVSTTYVDYDLLKAENGELAAELSNRYLDGNNIIEDRGNPTQKDWYFYMGIDVSYKFEMRRVKGIFNKNYRMVSCKIY